MNKFLALTCATILLLQTAKAQIITYKAPESNLVNHTIKVDVRQGKGNWLPVDVYKANVAARFDAQQIIKKTAFSYFDCSGPVRLRVKLNQGVIKDVRIRPANYGIKPEVKGDFIEFELNPSQYVSLEVNGNIFENLQIFANPIETNRPTKNDAQTLYFGPGIHKVGRMVVPSGKTIYVAGGAIVEGSLIIDHAENIRICGRGILTQHPVQSDSSALKKTATTPSKFRNDHLIIQNSNNISVDGIIELPTGYSILMGESKHVSISNFKAFSSSGNADGIDIFCSEDIKLDHIYMRNSDDCIAIYGHRWDYYGNTSDITINNAILWADVAHPLLIGTHGDTDHPDTLQNIKVQNLTILDHHENQVDYQGCISLNAGDSNLIRNVSFENVEIEDIRKGQLFNLRVMYNHKYNTSPGMGIENILFRNVNYNGTHANMSVIAGYDDQHKIRNIIFENLKINGTLIYDQMPGKPAFYKTGDMANIFIGEHVDGIQFLRKD
ncbi:Glycosyl hydrolases family 28 [Mucilaginibacter gossypiicola]|uniref:Glycosyl hydrolases family 28 n=1 Tax=Mucilaginibacter gossypiicola TaxID=551995 RepID=A0A1H8TKI8_9SPHI|nr:glycosyl hydrolase family 28 protein [Mucilaginibacter gossypiicola]SEO91074.1 Glycosyl hydrolases family 28 [Mucilaginibacter gossypiicola]